MHRYTHIQFCSTAFCSMTFLGSAMLQKTDLFTDWIAFMLSNNVTALKETHQLFLHPPPESSIKACHYTLYCQTSFLQPQSESSMKAFHHILYTLQCKSNFNQQHKITNNIY